MKNIYSKDHQHIVKQLRQARVEAGLSQKDVAKRVGKSQSYVSKLESGQRRVDVIQLKDFVKVYKKEFDFFVK